MTASDRLYLWVGVNLTSGSNSKSVKAELDIEGTLNGNYDSRIVVPQPVPAPTIQSIFPLIGPVGTSVTVNGSNFGATKGTSTLKFNGVTSIPTTWSDIKIVTPVPSGATTGSVIATVAGVPSNSITFNVGNSGTAGGKITQSNGTTPISGATVEAFQNTTLMGSAVSNGTGDYSITGLIPGTATVQASAVGYEPKNQTGVTITAGVTTTVNLSLNSTPSGNTIAYVYDELGRLVGVTDPAGETATYKYDAVGNLLSVTRQGSTQVSIVEFTPNSGVSGTAVTISGTGFSTTPSQNTVKFNGVTAAVTSATATQLVATVPAGASTGTISVTSPSGSATSSSSFVVAATGNPPPTISSFTPTTGAFGTGVTITGTNFDTTPGNNKILFNATYASVNTASTTNLSTSVPSAATSGRISVITPYGNAVSSQDFFIPPPPYAAGDVEYMSRMQIGETKTVTTNTPLKVGMLLFDGALGQRISLLASNVTYSTCVNISILNPNGTTLASQGCVNANNFIDTQVLPTTGTYTVLVDPDSNGTGSLTLTVYDVPPDFTGTISIGGSAVTATMSTPGQNAKLTFTGTAGQRVSFYVPSRTINSCVGMSILKPDLTTLVSHGCLDTGTFIEPFTLPATGTYTVPLDPVYIGTGSITITLYNVPADATGTITTGGSAATISNTIPGQNMQLSFSGTTGQKVSLQVTSRTINSCVGMSILNPDQTTLVSHGCLATGTFIEPFTLPATGTYTMPLDPVYIGTGSITIILYDVPANTTGTITIGGSAATISNTVPGQNMQLTFTGTIGQRVSLNVTNRTINNCVGMTILNPDQTTLISHGCLQIGTFIEPFTLPTTGTYTMSLDPVDVGTGSITIILYNVQADVTGTVTIGGAAVPVTITAPGQNGRLTFAGTSGQQVTVHITGNTIAYVIVSLLRPDGSVMVSTGSGNGSFDLATQTLAATDTYAITVDPNGLYTGNLNVSVTSP